MINKNKSIIGLAVILFAVFSGIMALFISNGDSGKTNKNNTYASDSYINDEIKESSVFLYFGNRNKPYLISEERLISHPENPVLFGKMIIAELIKGSNTGLMRTVSADTRIRAFFITKSNTAYIDFSREISDSHPGGGPMENLTVYSIVNSLALNIPGIENVKILVDGQESETLAGHINIKYPFTAQASYKGPQGFVA